MRPTNDTPTIMEKAWEDFKAENNRRLSLQAAAKNFTSDDSEKKVPLHRQLEVLKSIVRYADGKCPPSVQAAINANRDLLNSSVADCSHNFEYYSDAQKCTKCGELS